MSKFRKKPVVIEALRLGWDNWSEMCEHAGVGKLTDGKPEGGYVGPDGTFSDTMVTSAHRMALAIPTLEGLMIATEGDWVIRGIKNELYPCKAEIFDATYEEVKRGLI